MKKFKRYTVTSALPYANGPVHIGHLAGVYVPADIYVRYLREKKEDVVFIGGSDEHGVPITIKARNEGVSPQDIVDKYHTIISKSFEEFGISFDIYSRTTSKIHHKTAADFFKKLYAEGKFIEKVSEQYYDNEAHQFLADRYIKGTCPHCNNENAYGDQCEQCGSSLSPTDLKNPKSMLSGSKPEKKQTKHWYLPLNEYEVFLKKWILEDHKEWKTNVYGQCKSWLDTGLHPRAVSRDLNWGVPVPVENAEGKVLYVWFDAPIGYVSNTIEWAEKNNKDWKPYWQSEDTKLVHFIGKDNIVFHCIIFPTMLKAHGNFILPDNVPGNEFLNLENDKISTSRNWAVWLHEYLIDFPEKQDVLRYVLTANMPETKDNDFTWKDFQTRNNNELVAILGNFINRTAVLTQKYYQGKVPALGKLKTFDNEIVEELHLAKKNIETNIETFHFREALKEAMNIARLGNKYLADTEPWKVIKTDEERVQTIMNICLQITANLSIAFEPFLPFTTEKIRQLLNIQKYDWELLGSINLMQEEQMINKPFLIFDKVEDEEIDLQIEKLRITKEKQRKEQATVDPAKPEISFDDFVKTDIRTGIILQAEKVPKTQKLLKLLVDTGIDKRTIVSGIAESYQAENIIGKKVSILVNLAPRKIKGIESQGMILMAENSEGELSFISCEKDFSSGCTIR